MQVINANAARVWGEIIPAPGEEWADVFSRAQEEAREYPKWDGVAFTFDGVRFLVGPQSEAGHLRSAYAAVVVAECHRQFYPTTVGPDADSPVRFTPGGGENIKKCAGKIIRLAQFLTTSDRQIGNLVVMRFNGVEITVDPTSDPNQIDGAYMRALHREISHVGPHPGALSPALLAAEAALDQIERRRFQRRLDARQRAAQKKQKKWEKILRRLPTPSVTTQAWFRYLDLATEHADKEILVCAYNWAQAMEMELRRGRSLTRKRAIIAWKRADRGVSGAMSSLAYRVLLQTWAHKDMLPKTHPNWL